MDGVGQINIPLPLLILWLFNYVVFEVVTVIMVAIQELMPWFCRMILELDHYSSGATQVDSEIIYTRAAELARALNSMSKGFSSRKSFKIKSLASFLTPTVGLTVVA